MNGADGRSRTSDRLVRSQVLYPAELHPQRVSIFPVNSQRWCGWEESNLRPPGS
ncbi:conserved protein of unknown function [Shewanella benthica]|uniref:Uncharacterized protein n=1 Tax=Shewanella benthica TaxID=43661 RepID=A0A330M734_9GAMM|nr:conserved protein of unknown function [Shewanella benthica]